MRKGLAKFVAFVEIGSKAKTKKEGQNTVTSSCKIYFLVKNDIIYLMQKNGLLTIFEFYFCIGNYE